MVDDEHFGCPFTGSNFNPICSWIAVKSERPRESDKDAGSVRQIQSQSDDETLSYPFDPRRRVGYARRCRCRP
jgi:hypothetical protein